MIRYAGYVTRLVSLVSRADQQATISWQRSVTAALDGEANFELRRLAPLQALRDSGAFFSSSRLSARLLQAPNLIGPYYDPTCGAGALLLAAARTLPVKASLHETLSYWGELLGGTDKFDHFISATKLRLTLLALQKLSTPHSGSKPDPSPYFPNIHVADARLELGLYKSARTILLNPPFTLARASGSCAWASGRITMAADFFAHALTQTTAGTQIHAILPEVLRTGSRYSKWRSFVEERAEFVCFSRWGLFDDKTDVDVFMLRMVRSDKQSAKRVKWVPQAKASDTQISNHFEVRVGTVVPFRDPLKGPKSPYITVHNAPRWGHVKSASTFRRYSGHKFMPPFVLVRRTSRPNDRFRAVATLVTGGAPVAVENHLLVCTPSDGTLKRCKQLVKLLKKQATNRWLNRRIRCRHLTVRSLADMPWA